MAHDPPSARETSRKWTRIEDYLTRFGRRRSPPPLAPRTEPEEPRFVLSTLPFLLLILSLFAIAAGIMILAWPGNQPYPQPRVPEKEQGVASRGWLDEAKQEFHRDPPAKDRK